MTEIQQSLTVIAEKIKRVLFCEPDARDLQFRSSLGIKYPKWRDHPLHSTFLWLESKKIDDGSEGLWRIHDSLYDLSGFVEKHPGGTDWLTLTKGTDITEAYEAHHLSDVPNTMLPKFFIRKANKTRNSPFTFKEDGFYRTLRRNVGQKLTTIPREPVTRSKLITDLLFVTYFGLAIIAAFLRSYTIGIGAGIALALTAIAAHNYFHQKDSFRMFYFDLTLMSSRKWRVSHVLSHHLYTNTINDLEISMVEPFFQYLPTKKPFVFRYFSLLYWPIVYGMSFFGTFVLTSVQKLKIGEKFTWESGLPLLIPSAMYIFTGQSLVNCMILYVWILTVSSFCFSFIGLNAGHHHPDVFHDGDGVRKNPDMDWGMYQLEAVMDREDVTGSHFRVLTSFGDHALHHLFPTIDHGLLEHLYPVFFETCQQFGVEWKLSSQLNATIGQFKQLTKVEPNRR